MSAKQKLGLIILIAEIMNESQFYGQPSASPSLEAKTAPRPKGHSLFHVNGVEVWALNYKNALRKANK